MAGSLQSLCKALEREFEGVKSDFCSGTKMFFSFHPTLLTRRRISISVRVLDSRNDSQKQGTHFYVKPQSTLACKSK